VVVSPDPDNAGTVYALYEADSVIMVTKNNISNYKRLPIAMNIVGQYKKSEEAIKLVHNMYSVSSNADLGNLAKDNQVEVLGLVEYDENSVDNLNLANSLGVKFFKSKAKNQETFSTIIKSL